MMRPVILASCLASSVLLITTPALAGPPSISVASTDTQLSQADCLQKGAVAMRAIGFTQNFETVGNSVFGEQGEYTGVLRCIAAKGVVVFFVAGPDVDKCSSSQKALSSRFLN